MAADERDLFLIKQHFDALRGRAGALVIKMRLEQMSGVVMNRFKPLSLRHSHLILVFSHVLKSS